MSWFTFRHEAMATYFEIAIAGQDEGYARQASAAAFREITRLEQELSRFIPSSDISRANRVAEGESLVVTPDTLECLLIAADAALATQRAFDAAYGSQRAQGDDSVGFVVNPETYTLTSTVPRLQLDLGAVGKGFALDRSADTLREWNVSAACLVAGGSTVLALQPPPGMAGWPIGIGDGAALKTITLTDVALSASGTAVKGSHVVDPRTGKPATRTSRAWALAGSGAQSDAISTAFFVMTDGEVAEFCLQYPGIGAALAGDNTLGVFGALRNYV